MAIVFSRTSINHVEESAPLDVQPGDLVVSRKANSALDKLITGTHDPFHHIGIVVDYDGELTVAEFTFAGCCSRPLQTFVDHYDDVAVLHTNLSADERARVNAVAIQHLGSTATYAWDEVVLTGLVALARDRQHTKHSLRAGWCIARLEAAVYRRNRSSRRALFCSSFVVAVFQQAEVAGVRQLGAISPPVVCKPPNLEPTERDGLMHCSLRRQMAINVSSLIGLCLGIGRPIVAAAPPIISPSDFWRHVPATRQFLCREGVVAEPTVDLSENGKRRHREGSVPTLR